MLGGAAGISGLYARSLRFKRSAHSIQLSAFSSEKRELRRLYGTRNTPSIPTEPTVKVRWTTLIGTECSELNADG